MREADFRRALSSYLSARTVDSYVAYCRRVERALAVDIDHCDLDKVGLASLGVQLRLAGLPANSVMNCLSGLRAYTDALTGLIDPTPQAVVPTKDCGSASISNDEPALSLAPPVRAAEEPSLPKRLSLSQSVSDKAALEYRSVGDLLVLYGEIMDELRKRGVVRTGNSPVGDYSELLFADAFAWSLEPNSASGHDATDQQGKRYQIKGRRLSGPGASRQLSAFRQLNDDKFDFLAAVLFDISFKVTRAIIVPYAIVFARARHTQHTNSWTFILDDGVWNERGVLDVTAEIAVAASRF